MRIKVLSAIALSVLVLASCGVNRPGKGIAAKPFASSDNGQFTVIGSMQNRDRIVTIKTGPTGIVYSISTKDGKNLYENISPEKLQAEAPAIHDFIESGTAGYAGIGWFDARFNAPFDARR